jgi:hypothetical protein
MTPPQSGIQLLKCFILPPPVKYHYNTQLTYKYLKHTNRVPSCLIYKFSDILCPALKRN